MNPDMKMIIHVNDDEPYSMDVENGQIPLIPFSDIITNIQNWVEIAERVNDIRFEMIELVYDEQDVRAIIYTQGGKPYGEAFGYILSYLRLIILHDHRNGKLWYHVIEFHPNDYGAYNGMIA